MTPEKKRALTTEAPLSIPRALAKPREQWPGRPRLECSEGSALGTGQAAFLKEGNCTLRLSQLLLGRLVTQSKPAS
jgi:hypothetical protein